jgi:aspartate carbamoyltransferase regulatory subunit
LGNVENKDKIKIIIELPVKESIKDLVKIEFKDLTSDQKDLLVLSAWLNRNDLILPIIKDSKIDQVAYDKIASDELVRL